MSRTNSEDSQAFNTHFQSGRFSHSRRVLVGDVEITVNGSLVNFFDPNGAERTATLPVLEKGRFYVVSNVGDTYNVLVRSAAGVLITTLLPDDSTLLFASDEEWVALRGWAALGVFTNTINGLVPAPNSGTPGSLFLRDDGQWAQVQTAGIVDAFKYITDGTNTAEGSGPDTFYIRSASGKIGIVVTNSEAVYGDNVNLTVNEGSVNHDALLNFFANEHIDHTGVTLTAGVGISGGGDISASRTFDFDPATLTVNAAPVLSDYAVMDLAAGGPRVALWSSINAIFDHNAMVNYVADRHIAHSGVSIVVGAGLTGGGDITTSRSVNLDFGSLVVDTPTATDSIPFYDTSGGDHNRATIATLNGIFDHNLLTNYVANQHINHTSVVLTAGAGLTGGGDISASRTFDVGAGSGIAVSANAVALDIAGLTTVTPVALDLLPFYDISGTINANMTISSLNAMLDHDAMVNFFLNEHIDHTTVSIATSEGIQGGGTIAATRNLKLDVNGLTAYVPVGATDYVPVYDAAAGIHKKALAADLGAGTVILRSYLAGYGMVWASTTTITVNAGMCADSSNAVYMSRASATKSTAAWVTGSTGGGLDTGAIAANTTYHWFIIRNPTSGVVDVIFSTGVSSPTVMPAGYTQSRRIGSRRTNASSQWHSFVQDGDIVMLSSPALDVTATNPGTAAVTRTLTSIPTGVRLLALTSVGINATAANVDAPAAVYLSDLSLTDLVPNVGVAQTFEFYMPGVTTQVVLGGQVEVMTNTSAQIRSRLQLSAAGTTLNILTNGWVDTRGKES